MTDYVTKLEEQCKAWEKIYNEDIAAMTSDRDRWRQRAWDAEAKLRNTEKRAERIQSNLRHV